MPSPGETYAALRARADAAYAAWERPERPRISLAEDTSSLAAGAHRSWEALKAAVERRNAAVDLGMVVGYGLQWLQPLADITWPDGTRVLYGPVTPDRVDTLIDEATGRVGAAAGLAIGTLAGSRPGIPRIEAHPFFAHERERRLLARIGRTCPDELDHYLATGGYFASARMIDRHQDPQTVRQTVIDSGLWGRGGAAFPAGVKWNFLAGAPEGRDRYLVCNADEGDPGGWVNRVLLEGDPHLILEGMLIAAFATGAHYGYIYIRNEYPLAVERMRRAIAVAEAAGILGPHVLGSDFACTFEVAQGAGAYVCGDETGLIASLQDGRGMPRIKPPFPANAGVLLQPSNVNNVETYANVPLIMQHGAEWYRAYGTQADPGTKIFSFSGNIARAGFMELPFGTPLRAVLDACGGVVGGELKAIQPGGPLIGYLPASTLDRLTLERAPFSAQGAGLGGGGIVFVGPDNCSVDLNVLFAEFVEEESCGRCTTCHHGNQRMHEIFQRISDGRGRHEDRHALELVGETLQFSNCAHGQLSPTIMRNTLRHFQAEYDAHIAGECQALRCAGLTRFRVVDQSDPRLADAQTICPTEAIVGEPGERQVLDERCIRCGACTDLAPRGIAREAAPAGTALPARRPADPPGMPAAAGNAPLTWQATALARPEGGHGGPAPSPVTLFV
jgi:NADH-quinone oxidoreductase subunit F